MFGSIFAAFHIVDYVPKARAFFLIRHHCSKKFQSRQKVLYIYWKKEIFTCYYTVAVAGSTHNVLLALYGKIDESARKVLVLPL